MTSEDINKMTSEDITNQTNCKFCQYHYMGDTLYESADWDNGIGFDYIRDIKFCPICGKELQVYGVKK